MCAKRNGYIIINEGFDLTLQAKCKYGCFNNDLISMNQNISLNNTGVWVDLTTDQINTHIRNKKLKHNKK